MRVSSLDQPQIRQLEGLALNKTFTDKASGKDVKSPQLEAMQSFVKETQCFVTRWTGWPATLMTCGEKAGSDGAGRPYRLCEGKLDLHWRGFAHVESVAECHGGVCSVREELIRERQREGIATAKREGKYTGRKPSLSPSRAAELRRRVADGDSKAALAREFGISRNTLYRYVPVKKAPVWKIGDELYEGNRRTKYEWRFLAPP
jgi:hypothetical protein